ncbi:MAG: FeoB-associated Cys-rich membrane protein [Planctomycetia bacterium]|nr:FeoB-associated Cys-rich membrane protein [Planctomycetia bacterium]
MTAALSLAQTEAVLAFSWQDAAALGLSLCAAAYIVSFVVRALYRKARGGCGSCGSCASSAAGGAPQLVGVDALKPVPKPHDDKNDPNPRGMG